MLFFECTQYHHRIIIFAQTMCQLFQFFILFGVFGVGVFEAIGCYLFLDLIRLTITLTRMKSFETKMYLAPSQTRTHEMVSKGMEL